MLTRRPFWDIRGDGGSQAKERGNTSTWIASPGSAQVDLCGALFQPSSVETSASPGCLCASFLTALGIGLGRGVTGWAHPKLSAPEHQEPALPY